MTTRFVGVVSIFLCVHRHRYRSFVIRVSQNSWPDKIILFNSYLIALAFALCS